MIEFGRIEIGGLDVKITADNRPSPAEEQNRYTWPGHPPSSPQPTHMFRSSKNESIAARVARLRAEAEATGRRVSDEIDEQLKQDRAQTAPLRKGAAPGSE